jgi:hypothetical protein
MKVHLNNVRLTFPQLFDAKQVNGQGDPKFSAAFLIPRDHPQIGAIKEAIKAAAEAKWGAKALEVLKALQASDKLALHDGDAKSDYDGYAGNFFVNASNKIRPLVIGPQREPLTASDGKPYSGCYVNAIVEFWAQDNQFGKRVNASLLGVQFAKDGERLAGGGVASQDDFEPIPGTEAAAQSAPSQPAGGASALF